jgi:hypothetical protein
MRWTAGVSDAHVFVRPGTRSVLAAALAGWIGAGTSAEDSSQGGAAGDESIGGEGPAVF